VLAGQTAQYFINYSYFIDPGPIMDDAQLSLIGDPGLTTVTQFFCNDLALIDRGPMPMCVNPTNDRDASAASAAAASGSPQMLQVTTTDPTASIMFSPPAQSFGSIETEIMLDGTNGSTYFGSIVGNLDVVTPEPASIVLVLGGLAAIGLRRRQTRTRPS
jgi:hypothetical protein